MHEMKNTLPQKLDMDPKTKSIQKEKAPENNANRQTLNRNVSRHGGGSALCAYRYVPMYPYIYANVLVRVSGPRTRFRAFLSFSELCGLRARNGCSSSTGLCGLRARNGCSSPSKTPLFTAPEPLGRSEALLKPSGARMSCSSPARRHKGRSKGLLPRLGPWWRSKGAAQACVCATEALKGVARASLGAAGAFEKAFEETVRRTCAL